ncbi:hypothetical protein V7S43_002090 [Phytophthora oleae]|uniref:Uncharacterized protein n=1 Tax=Phytophthora oleae TaxID=2107226 RepID=A0ABD3G494_9STRA
MLDPCTKFSVDTIIRSSNPNGVSGGDKAATAASCRAETVAASEENAPGQTEPPEMLATERCDQELREVIEAGTTLLRHAHREVYAAPQASGNTGKPQASTLPNLDLVPCVDDEVVLCGAQLQADTSGSASTSSMYEQADEVLQQWLSFRVNWVEMATYQTSDNTKTEDSFIQLLLVRRNGVVSDRLQAVLEHVDVCR